MSAIIRRLSEGDCSQLPEFRRTHQFNDNAVRLTRTLTD